MTDDEFKDLVLGMIDAALHHRVVPNSAKRILAAWREQLEVDDGCVTELREIYEKRLWVPPVD